MIVRAGWGPKVVLVLNRIIYELLTLVSGSFSSLLLVAGAVAAAVPGGTSGACAESEEDVSADAGRGGGDGRRGGWGVPIEIHSCLNRN